MITATLPSDQPPRWQLALRSAITDPAELLAALGLDPALLPAALAAAGRFPLKVPRGFVARMRRADPQDPLLRQVLPLGEELDEVPGYVGDPVGDLASIAGAGVLQKYRGRALLIATGACAVHCRYCFRREFPYAGHIAAAAGWQPAIAELRARPVEEIILSGGDPLLLADHKLRALTDGLAHLRQVKRLRIHTRLPVVLPERIDEGFVSWLASVRQRVVVVIHANHANELDSNVAKALARMARSGVTLLNQSVLLRGVNDCANALVELSGRLFELGVLPYYLHLLDPVRGSSHFETGGEQAAILMSQVAARLPGYLVPRLVREVPGKDYKTPVPWQVPR